jgi:hypothetical protein
MQIDAYLKKEQIGTLFVLVGAPEGGLRGGGQGGPAQKSYVPIQKRLWRLLPPEWFFTACVVFLLLSAFTYISQKQAYRYGFSPNANCPICPCTESALHILSGCQHTKMRNMIIKRHNNMASVMIVQALQKGPCGANQIACSDVRRQRR